MKLDFTRHALPPATVDDMDSMSNTVLARNLAYAAMQAMTYLAAESYRVQQFDELDHVHSFLAASKSRCPKSCYDVSPNESDYLLSGDARQWLAFYPFCEVVDCHD